MKKLHYVYLLEVLTPWDERSLYIGKHSGQIEDMGATYFSSGAISKYYKENPNDVKVTILHILDSQKEASLTERIMQELVDAKDNKRYFNRMIASEKTIPKKMIKRTPCIVCGQDTYHSLDKHNKIHKKVIISIQDKETGDIIPKISEYDFHKNYKDTHIKIRKVKEFIAPILSREDRQKEYKKKWKTSNDERIIEVKRLIDSGIIDEQTVYDMINICPNSKDVFELILKKYTENKNNDDKFIIEQFKKGEIYTNEDMRDKYNEYTLYCGVKGIGFNNYKRLVRVLVDIKDIQVWNKNRSKKRYCVKIP